MNHSLDKKDIYKEVFVVLSNFNDVVIRRIPIELFRQIADYAADSEVNVYIDMNKRLFLVP